MLTPLPESRPFAAEPDDAARFAAFRATGRDVDDLATCFPGQGLAGQPGRVYGPEGGPWFWVIDNRRRALRYGPTPGIGRWHTEIANACYQADELTEIERPLYEFARGEGCA